MTEPESLARSDAQWEIRQLQPGDEALVHAAAALFDAAPQATATARFLAEPGHHLLIAYVQDAPAGFITGVEVTHPDKGTEMFLYELGVDDAYRRRGIGAALTEALAALARERGCYGMWVLTERDNVGALRTYSAAGGGSPETSVMFSWTFEKPSTD